MHQPENAHNLKKLGRSGAPERHMFIVIPGFPDTPFGVTELLTRDDAPLPSLPPKLPSEVTHVWAASTWGVGYGMRWSPARGWEAFDKLTTQLE
jgi:hypothetical protein